MWIQKLKGKMSAVLFLNKALEKDMREKGGGGVIFISLTEV